MLNQLSFTLVKALIRSVIFLHSHKYSIKVAQLKLHIWPPKDDLTFNLEENFSHNFQLLTWKTFSEHENISIQSQKMKSARKISKFMFVQYQLAWMQTVQICTHSTECAGFASLSYEKKKAFWEKKKISLAHNFQRDEKICLSNSINAQQDLLRDVAKSDSHQMIMKVMWFCNFKG